MVWPFSSGTKRVHNHEKIQAHLQARDRALAIALPPSSNADTLQIQKSLDGTDPSEELFKGMDIGLKPLDADILAADFATLTAGIQNKQWTVVDVLTAFIRSARRAQIRTNCLTEVNLDHALVRAAELDKYFEQTGQLVGPLHGIPISIKDHYNVKNVPLSLGFTSWFSKSPPSESAAVVLLLEHLGAVPFVKTNIPQTMLAFECQNPVFGRTLNPYSPHHSSGGSSGGEAALIASDGAAAGTGSDIGGSLRIPVGYCGVYSLKPSAEVYSMAGSADFAKGFEGIHGVAGPITRSARDLQTLHMAYVGALQPPRPKAITSGDEGDDDDSFIAATAEHDKLLRKVGLSGKPRMAPVNAWLQPLKVAEQRGSPLRIGYYFTDGFIKTTPACYRAMKESLAALQARYPQNQIELVAIAPKDVQPVEGLEHFLGLTSADGYDYLTKPHLGRDKPDPSLFLPLLLARLPMVVKRVVAFIARFILRDARMARLVVAAGRRSAKQYFQVTESRTRWSDDWTARVWEGYNLDAILCPVQATPAVPHGGSTKLSMMCIATALYNVLDCAVATLPVTRVDARTDSHRAADFKDVGAADERRSTVYDEWSQDPELKKCSHLVNFELYTQGVYDAKKMDGLPVGVQVVARPYEEEKAIGIMRLLDDALPPSSQRGPAGWINQLDRSGRIIDAAASRAAAGAAGVRISSPPGFGPGTYTAQVYGAVGAAIKEA